VSIPEFRVLKTDQWDFDHRALWLRNLIKKKNMGLSGPRPAHGAPSVERPFVRGMGILETIENVWAEFSRNFGAFARRVPW